jgi:enolase-phosphatase E1
VTISLSALAVRAVVLDIEGTTTPVSFVYDVLFPFARRHAEAFLRRQWNSDDRRGVVGLLAADHAAEEARGESPPSLTPPDSTPAQVAAFSNWLSDRDRKSPGLKALQGLVWQDGYDSGELRGQVYADVAPALARWRARERDVYIYSSGSILAQQLLFRSTDAGDLTRFLSGYFDTGVGAKTDPKSYRSIVNRLAAPPASILFVSDVVAELDAAREAGLHTALCVRESAGAETYRGAHPFVRSFDEIVG